MWKIIMIMYIIFDVKCENIIDEYYNTIPLKKIKMYKT